MLIPWTVDPYSSSTCLLPLDCPGALTGVAVTPEDSHVHTVNASISQRQFTAPVLQGW